MTTPVSPDTTATMGTWLVVGGAGYIGAHVVRRLHAEGRRLVVLDDLSTGEAARLPADVPLVVAPVGDRVAVAGALRDHSVSGVVHLAARKSVSESVAAPLRYYRENVDGMRVLLDEAAGAGVSRFVLSSSAAVYGVPSTRLVTEENPTTPISPYGETKLICEWLLRSAGTANGLSWITLRNFNVVGADSPQLADTGHHNLFQLVFREVLSGRPAVVTGCDYPTGDGTGVRDYVHVADVADAHVASVRRLEQEPSAQIYNVGRGRGYSVLEVLDAVRTFTGKPVKVLPSPRRPGDAPEVIANVTKIGRELDWRARHDLHDMVRSTWQGWQNLGTAAVR